MNWPRITRNTRMWLAIAALALGAAAAVAGTPQPKKPMAVSTPASPPVRPASGC